MATQRNTNWERSLQNSLLSIASLFVLPEVFYAYPPDRTSADSPNLNPVRDTDHDCTRINREVKPRQSLEKQIEHLSRNEYNQ
jgi:hypothetical protein